MDEKKQQHIVTNQLGQNSESHQASKEKETNGLLELQSLQKQLIGEFSSLRDSMDKRYTTLE